MDWRGLGIHDITIPTMVIVGIDPGVARVGWAAIHVHGPTITAEAYGCIQTDKKDEEGHRLCLIHEKVGDILKRYHPDCLSLEELFFATNAKTAIDVGQARGVILLVAFESKVPVVSYTPLAVKRTVSGDGHADKRQIEQMVMRILHLKTKPKPDDVADALAIALTHAYSYKLRSKII